MTKIVTSQHSGALFRQISLICLSLLCRGADSSAGEPLPSFVVIVADDLGYGDLGCFGHDVIRTPHIDQLASDGLLYTDCHSAATVCSPSRAGLLTGRNPRRVGVYGWIPEDSEMHLVDEELTVAEILQARGYATCLVGKYHCNGRFASSEQPQPGDQGFQHWFATQNNAHPTHENPDNFFRNGQAVGRLEGYSSPLIVDEALQWLESVEKGAPYALFVWFHAPHEPIETSQQFMDLYSGIDQPKRATYYGNVSEMDHNIGRLLQEVDRRGERDNTVVMFTSDNGPTDWYRKSYGDAGGLRGMKGEIWEGGHRVPGIVRWPNAIAPGTRSDELINAVDFLPTVCDIIGQPLPEGRPLDGASIVPTFTGAPVKRTVPLYWQKHWKKGPHVAMRDGNWKMVATYGDNWSIHNFRLFDLSSDLQESKNVASRHPERAMQMRQQLVRLHQEIIEEGPHWPSNP